MAKDKRPIEVLLIDDEDNFRSSFILDAKSHRILIKGYNNLESALECLEENKKIKFVILDAKCFVNENQKTGEEDVEFLMYAPRAIEKIQQQQNRLIPMCIYTGYSEYSDKYKGLGLKIFEKGLQADKLFHFIWESVENMDDVVVANEYSDVFEFVDDFFDIANTSLIIDLLKKDSFLISESAVLIKNLSALRRLNEHLMDIACENILKVNVSDITTNSGKRTVDIMDALEKHIKIPKSISFTVKGIYYNSSAYGNHNPSEDDADNYLPSKYLVAQMTFGLLESIKWFNKIIVE